MYIYMCVYVYIYRDPLQFWGGRNDPLSARFYIAPPSKDIGLQWFSIMRARGFWRKQEEQNRSQIERGEGEKKGKNRKTIDERFNRGLPSNRNRVDFKRMHFSRGLAFIKICIEARASQGRDEIPFCGRNEIENDEFFLEKGARKGRKRKEREKKKGKYRFSSLRELGRWGKNDEETGGNWRRVDKFAARCAREMFNIGWVSGEEQAAGKIRYGKNWPDEGELPCSAEFWTSLSVGRRVAAPFNLASCAQQWFSAGFTIKPLLLLVSFDENHPYDSKINDPTI